MNKKNPITYANQGVKMHSSHRQKGSLLPMTLIILLVVTLLVVSGVSSTNVSLQIAGNQQRQFETEMVADNQVTYLANNYPQTVPPEFVEDFKIDYTGSECLFQTKILDSAREQTPTDCNATVDFQRPKACQNSDWDEGALLNPISGSPTIWINGDFTTPAVCHVTNSATINYTGTYINSCFMGDLTKIAKNKVSVAQYNEAAGIRDINFDYYSHVEIAAIATDESTGATVKVVKGIKYRGDYTNSGTTGSRGRDVCNTSEDTISFAVEDPTLLEAGAKKVMYSYVDL